MFGIQHRHHADGAERALLLRQIEACLGRAQRLRACLQRIRVRLQSAQRVGHILKRGQNRAAILLGCLIIGCLRGPLLMEQCAALEERRRRGSA